MATAQTKAPERIALGSGRIYYEEFDGSISDLDLDTFCVPANELGHVKNGASIEYTPEYYEATSDLGLVKKQIMTTEEAVLTLGLITWNMNTLGVLSDTGRVTEDTSKKTRTIKIGGIANAKNKRYVFIFHHEDSIDGDIWIVIVGQNQSGFTLSFSPEEETIIEPEIKCLPQDGEGTLIQLVEKDDSITA